MVPQFSFAAIAAVAAAFIVEPPLVSLGAVIVQPLGDSPRYGSSVAAAGPLHGHHCVDTVVTGVRERKFSRGADGSLMLAMAGYGSVEFASRLGEEHATLYGGLKPYARIEFGTDPGSEVAAAERPGDRVQLCLILMPSRTAGCDPTVDDRGREYRVYDYRQNATYRGLSGEHLCG